MPSKGLPPYEIYKFSTDQLIKLISEKSTHNSPEVIKQKLHSNYFSDYFKYLRTKTIIVENNYIDRDYLEDYSSYYVRCFNEYEKNCTRFHFFNIEITDGEFEKYIVLPQDNIGVKNFKDAYLGFIVIKPLPETVIGRTCLITYPDKDSRHFPILRPYKPNLFGIDLEVNTLAFQEQDRITAACATSALWSVFHGTGKSFQHPILSPIEITKSACDRMPIETRIIPNRGLTLEMMAHAIQNIGLEPVMENVKSIYHLKTTLYAYLKGEISNDIGIRTP